MVQEKRLSVLVAMDRGEFSAYCPELDLATETDTYEETIEDIIEAIKDYSEEYMAEFDLYSKSPNRAHHLPYIDAIRHCKTDWELRMLIEIKHGLVHV
jgi:predicted RNase H-like HicB family nuclease